jgi:hypothetical protein
MLDAVYAFFYLLPPKGGIARTTFCEESGKLLFVGVVNGVVCLQGAADELLLVENPRIAGGDVAYLHWIHVMDDDMIENFIARDCEVTAKISHDHIATSNPPLVAVVEPLVLESLPTKGTLTHHSIQPEVVEPLTESRKRDEL